MSLDSNPIWIRYAPLRRDLLLLCFINRDIQMVTTDHHVIKSPLQRRIIDDCLMIDSRAMIGSVWSSLIWVMYW
jgi:hypothetical protein